MSLHDFSLVIIAFFSELIGTISGFGSSTFFVPAAHYIERFQLVLALTALLHCFGNFSRILIFKKDFQYGVFLKLVIPSILFTGLGALLTANTSTPVLRLILGILLMSLACIMLFAKAYLQRIPPWAAITLTAISGFFTGLVGTGGALRGIALTALSLERHVFVVTSASVDIGGDLIRAAIYLNQGFMDWSQWFYLPLLGIAAFFGAKIGQKIISRLKQQQFEKIVSLFVFISGLMMMLK